MNVIALWGCGNVGKTNTLKQVIRILIDECGAHKLVEYVADNKKDTRVVLEIHGKIIVVFTGGDDLKTLDKNFESVRLHQFDLLICACRSRGASCRCLEEKYTKDQILWYGQSKVSGLCNNIAQLELIRTQENSHLAMSIVQSAKTILAF